jgi:hypothetical protein
MFSEMALGGRKGRIPWMQLHQAQGDYSAGQSNLTNFYDFFYDRKNT